MGPLTTHGDGPEDPTDDITALVSAIAAERDTDPAELVTPLHEAIDIEALDRLLQSTDREARVTFTYEDLKIEVSGGGEITISKLEIEA